MNNTNNWFSQGGNNYANFRPQYPKDLIDYLLSLVSNKNVLLDVGCGNGQISKMMTPYFKTTLGLDSSLNQLLNAITFDAFYVCANAEQLPIKSASTDLIVVAQAAHWFNLDSFYQEVNRVLLKNGILALVSYGEIILDSDLNLYFSKFYYQDIYKYWPPQRRLVDSGYADIAFPFDDLDYPKIEINYYWDLNQFLGYILTWSAIKNMAQQGHIHLFDTFARNLAAIWGPPESKRLISWPINMRVGRK